MEMTVFGILDIWVVILDIVIVVYALQEKKWEGKSLGRLMLLSAGVNLSYLWSILAKTYFWMSFANSLYFSCITIMLTCLLQYIIRFAHFERRATHRSLFYLMEAYMVFDVVVQMVNPFCEISMHYIKVPESVTTWVYQPKLLYNMHLGFSYILLAYVVAVLAWKVYVTPSVYRSKYLSVLIALVMVVMLNGAFLFLYRGKVLDVSTLFYICIGVYLYWNTFHYSEKGMLNKVRQLVIDEFGRPVILFDDRNRLSMNNREIENLISAQYQQGEYTLGEFVRDAGFHEDFEHMQENTTFQYNAPENGKVYRCDFSVLRDQKERIIGRLFVLVDRSLEIDVLTEFCSKQTFMRHFSEQTDIRFPVGIAIFDINRLAQLNRSVGPIMGDKAIRLLADVMRSVYPKECYFARLDDANLCVICPETELKQMRNYTALVRQKVSEADFEYPFDIQCVLNIATQDIIKATEAASKSMRSKKLLDKTSAHSSLLDSLVQTQLEGDDATEEHVSRTRIMGEKLGMRLGLTDIELSNLQLLCLLHDIGKVGVPLEILHKPAKLNDAEAAVMRSHVEKGYRIAKASPELEGIATLILHHHECWDGKGYPDGLEKESIPLLSRMISILDSYDAMTNDRPYRKAMSDAQARMELRKCAGTQFDPFIVSEFIKLLEEEKPLSEREEKMVLPTQILPNGLSQIQRDVKSPGNVKKVCYSRYRMDVDCNILKVDENFETLTGYKQEDLETYRLKQWDLIFKEDLAGYQAEVLRMLQDKQEAFLEHRLRRKDASQRNVFCFGRQFYNSVSRTTQTEIVIADIENTLAMGKMLETRRRDMNRDAEIWIDKIRHDPLTKIFNREAYKNDVEMYLLDDNYKLLFFMMDIDHFKSYNDSYGHVQGDKLLIEVAKELTIVTQGVGIAGRLGGDEFSATILLQSELSDEIVLKQLEQIYTEIAQAIAAYDKDVTISIGATVSTSTRHSFQELYQAADEVLYQSKESGRNKYTFRK